MHMVFNLLQLQREHFSPIYLKLLYIYSYTHVHTHMHMYTVKIKYFDIQFNHTYAPHRDFISFPVLASQLPSLFQIDFQSMPDSRQSMPDSSPVYARQPSVCARQHSSLFQIALQSIPDRRGASVCSFARQLVEAIWQTCQNPHITMSKL